MTEPTPPVSSRNEPRFRDDQHRRALASAFQQQGQDYDRLRPGYPAAVLDAICGHVPASGRPHAVDLGAGTGKLAWALAGRGLDVTAVDPSAAMLETARRGGPSPSDPPTGSLRTVVASAEDTGLPAGSAHLVTAAQSWHWFDVEPASAEVVRLLAPGGVLALVWNTLEVSIPWVHRLSRIMHAGDVHTENFLPTVGPQLELVDRLVHRWEDPMPTHDVIDLACTRSYVITATEERRAKVLANLDWYLHEHLGHEPGSTVGIPYRTDLFVYRAARDAV